MRYLHAATNTAVKEYRSMANAARDPGRHILYAHAREMV
jgi:hypothetical protein